VAQSRYDFDVTVIGGGAAGSAAAQMAVRLGAKTALVDPDGSSSPGAYSRTIVALRHAASLARQIAHASRFGLAVEPPAIDFSRVMKAVRERADILPADPDRKAGKSAGDPLQRIAATATFLDPHTIAFEGERSGQLTSRYIVICTGSRGVFPAIAGLSPSLVVDAAGLLELEELPARLVVLGSGAEAVVLAQIFQRLGSKVTVVDTADEILSGEEESCARMVRRSLEDEGVRFLRGSHLDHAGRDNGESWVQVSSGDRWQTVWCDRILAASGGEPNVRGLGLESAGVEYGARGIQVSGSCQTSVPHIYACGEAVGNAPFQNLAEEMARVAVTRLLLKVPATFDPLSVPRAILTDPELARMGSTSDDLTRRRVRFETISLPFSVIDRGIAEGRSEGMLLLHHSPGSGKLLGGHIVGARAGEMINEVSVAMRNGLTLRDLADTVHSYPTFVQGIRLAAAVYGQQEHSTAVSLLMRSLFGYRGSPSNDS
jgi:pyruvate/2-oxoglutarate dehydrogenase complex dihydrolipoamide dehydrogenase (E3) component